LASETAASRREPQPDVLAAARDNQLGQYLTSRFLASPFAMSFVFFVVALVCLGIMIGFSQIGKDSEGLLYSVLRILVLIGCFGFVSALTTAIAVLVKGFQSWHLFAGGLVHRRNGKVTAVSWPQIAEIRPLVTKRGDNAGKVQNYQVVLRAGTPIAIPLVLADGRDEFLDALFATVRQHGVPVS
jgi:hypothetical protein